MFQWKTKFPTRPSPPTLEQQQQDLENLSTNDVLFESINETDEQIQKIRELIISQSILTKNVLDLDVSLEKLKESSKQLIELSEDVRKKASTTIS